MSDEMQIEGRQYISSKRASQMSGYAQDYIGQLARKSFIDARRIGGLWYVAMESLEAYKKKAEEYTPEPPVARSEGQEPGTLVFFDGKEYLSAARAAELTGYAQDYVGQLGRSGKILSQQVGNRWYVEKESLLGHKTEKDRLLAAVQSESVGLLKTQSTLQRSPEYLTNIRYSGSLPILNYYSEKDDLMPVTGKEVQQEVQQKDTPSAFGESDDDLQDSIKEHQGYSIPIRRAAQSAAQTPRFPKVRALDLGTPVPEEKKTLIPLLIGAAATIVIVVSVGYASLLKQNSAYAVGMKQFGGIGSLPASVEAAFGKMGNILEPLLTRELSYERVGPQ